MSQYKNKKVLLLRPFFVRSVIMHQYHDTTSKRQKTTKLLLFFSFPDFCLFAFLMLFSAEP